MALTSTVSTRLGLALIAAVFVTNVYRAATQSFTTDEAFTFLAFVHPHWVDTWKFYDANNHVLNSLVARLSMKMFGSGEFALRLPSLLAGGAYLAGAWVLARRVFRTGPLFLAALALLVLNPLVLDHLVACRGYGMALAGWIWGLLLLLDCLEAYSPAKLQAAAIVLALALCANLAFVFPVASTVLVSGAMLVARRGRDSVADLAGRFAVPAVVVCFVVLLLPLLHVDPSSFYYGAQSLPRAAGRLAEVSLFRDGAAAPDVVHRLDAQATGLAALALAAAAWAAAAALKRRLRAAHDVFLLLGGAGAVLTLAATVAAHSLTGMPYPLNRTAIYWVPLLSVMSLAAVQAAGWKPLTALAVLCAALLAGRYVEQARFDRFGEWPQDYGIGQLARVLKREAGNRPVRVCAPHARAMTLRYYRIRLAVPGWTIEESEDTTGPCDWAVVDARVASAGSGAVYRDRYLGLVRQVQK